MQLRENYREKEALGSESLRGHKVPRPQASEGYWLVVVLKDGRELCGLSATRRLNLG